MSSLQPRPLSSDWHPTAIGPVPGASRAAAGLAQWMEATESDLAALKQAQQVLARAEAVLALTPDDQELAAAIAGLRDDVRTGVDAIEAQARAVLAKL